jgi:Protein of unknown function (DUF2778)
VKVEHLRFGGPRELSHVNGCWPGIGLSSLIAGMAASAVTVASSISGGMPAISSDRESPGGRLIASVVGTISSEIGEYRAPTSSQIPGVRLASLDMDVTGGPASATNEGRTTEPIPAMGRDSFDERFNSSFGGWFSSFDRRFGDTTEGDRELAPGSVQGPRRPPAAELGGDNPARPETPKRQKARQAMLAPAASAAAATQTSAGAAKNKPTLPADTRGDALLASLGSRTAIYDISARVVYLPNGEKLEAHSGLGEHMDDPRSVAVKNRGATPPNVYALSLRERLFHGVRAVRLTPVEPDKMFGREGILAHSYLLGPNGDSNGCVSINDYSKFLNAFLNGEIERLVVVDRLADPPSPKTAVGWLSERIKAFFKSS